MCVHCWCVCLVGRVLCPKLCRCRSRVLPYAHILNRQLQQLPVPVCRLRAQGRIPAVCRLRTGPHTCSPPLPCLSSPVTVCAAAMNIRSLDRPMSQNNNTPSQPGWAPDPLKIGIRSRDGLVVGLAPATLEFWVRFPNERNQGKQGATLC